MVTIRKLDDNEAESTGLTPEQTELEALRAEVRGLTTLVRSVLASDQAAAPMPSREELEKRAPMLEPVVDERKRILAAWAAEPRVHIVISPNVDDERIRDDARARQHQPDLDYLPRTFQVNGVQISVPVGEQTSVPQSIAAMYAYMVNPLRARGITAPITFSQAERNLGIA